MQQIEDWLKQLGMPEYAERFADNKIDASVLPYLTDQDLKDIDVPLGHRRKMLAAIAELSVATQPKPELAASVELKPQEVAERRQVTVIFSDLVGSTALSARMDPEDMRELISAYQKCVAETVSRFGGFIAKYMGDGVLVYFGYPHAHEDDAERAVRAGLELIAAVGGLKTRVTLQARVGIATGLVVVGDLIGSGEAQERGVVGETPNLAARLQTLATPNTLVIGEATRRQIGGLFDLEDLGPQQLAGFSGPKRVWRVLGESGEVSRFEALRSGETPLVGREEEVELLIRRWRQAKSGEGRVVLLSGEPGIGKSRLTAALSEHIEAEPHVRMRYFCSPHHQDSLFYPVIGQLERAAGFARDDGPEAKLDKLATLLAPAAEAGDISLLVDLLSLPSGARFAPLELSPQRKKECTFAALLRQLEGLGRQQPILMIFEDLHWIDPTSREFLDLVLPQIDHLPVLLVATFRPEFQPPWTGQPYVTAIALNRLGRSEGVAMIQRLAGNACLLPQDLIAEIVERTDGVPLFVEEMTKAVLEAGAERGREIAASTPATRLGVPATLQASLMARIARLGPVSKGVAQIGAAIGREFSYELAVSVGDLAQERFHDALQRLVDAGLVFQRGVPPTAEYLFKHALVQDAAYGTLLRGTRRQLHARIATSLEAHFPDRVAREPEALARHFSEAQQPDRALGYWLAAGERAIRRSANQEAIGHLTTGLAQLAQLPDTADRTRQELALQRLLGQANFAVKGLAAVETDRAFSRARELCVATDDDQSIIPVLFGNILVEWGSAQFAKAETTANEIFQRAERTGDTGAGIAADFAVAATCLQSGGNLPRARRHYDSAISSYRDVDAAAAHRFAYDYSIELGAFSFVYAGWCSWLLGYPDQSLRLVEESITVGERVRHDYSRSRVLYCKSVVHAFRREWALVEECAVASIAVAQERGLGMMVAVARIMWTAAQAMHEPSSEAVAEIRKAIRTYRATGNRLHSTHHLILLTQALAACGHYGEGLATVREAATLVDEIGERMVEAEIRRLEGNLLLAENGWAEAEARYVKALEVARAQEARSLELRAATSLAGLWAERGRSAEARDLLTPVYGWFTEGFGTRDLKEARALLDTLVS